MCIRDRSGAHVDGGGGDFVRPKQMDGVAHPCDVGHRVQRAHLVEVHLLHRAAVGLGLGGGDGVVNAAGVAAHLLREGEGIDERGDVPWGGVTVGVSMAVMGVLMAVGEVRALLCAVNGHLPVSYTHLDVYKRQPIHR